MHGDKPVRLGQVDATCRNKLGLRTRWMVLLGAGVLCAVAWGAPASGDKTPTPAKAKEAAPSDFVGQEVCAGCHEKEASGFASNAHSKLAEAHGGKGVTCEGCHGAGRAHVEGGGDIPKKLNPATASVREVDSMCLTCHQSQHANFERSAHGENNVSCVSCHSMHSSTEKEHLLKAEVNKLCFQCHTDVKPQFSMPFHHKVNEGLVQCTDCHDPHGTFGKKNLRTSAQQDAVCTKCHTETAGPFVYEHNVVKTEGCTACHSPHGSPNARLLNRANVNTLCLQCHSPSTNFTTPVDPTFHNQAVQYQACTICHTSIHGSNVSAIFFNSN